MQYYVNNKELNEIVRQNGEPVFPERFWAEGAEKAVFTLRAGKTEFAWNGYPGELYEAWAPLNATAWGEEERARFAHWRCAVFTPADMNREDIPVVLAYTGISGDFSDTALFLRPVVEKLGCIFVAIDTHMTGERHLADEETAWNNRFRMSLLHLERKGCVLRDDFFKEAVEELAFNACQVLSLIQQLCAMATFPKAATLGFSLGGFYAAQVACYLPSCLGTVAGAGAPDILLYKGLFKVMRTCPNFVYELAMKIPEDSIAALLAQFISIKRVHKTPIALSEKSDVSQTYFIIGEKDKIVSVAEVKAFCAPNPVLRAISVPECGHTPCVQTPHGQVLNGVGHKMLDSLASLVS